MKLINQSEEKMFNRNRVVFSVMGKKSPIRSELQVEIAKLQKAKPELVVVEKIKSINGNTESKIEATIYSDLDSYKKFVPKFLKKKSEIKKAEPVEETKE